MVYEPLSWDDVVSLPHSLMTFRPTRSASGLRIGGGSRLFSGSADSCRTWRRLRTQEPIFPTALQCWKCAGGFGKMTIIFGTFCRLCSLAPGSSHHGNETAKWCRCQSEHPGCACTSIAGVEYCWHWIGLQARIISLAGLGNVARVM